MAVLNGLPPGPARMFRGGKAALARHGKRLRLDRRGSVAAIMGLSAIPLIAAVGIGVDLTRMAAAKAKLQTAADAAALAGAILYTDATKGSVAQSSAQNYFNRYSQTGDFNSVTGVVTTAAVGGSSGSFQVTVTATAVVPTTLMKVISSPLLGMSSFADQTVTTTATAAIPWSTPHFSPAPGGGAIGTPSQVLQGTNNKSTAWDWNAAYAYAVPMVNGVPNFAAFPPFSEFVEIASNCSAAVDSAYTSGAACNGKPGAIPPVAPSFAPLPDQPIAFMFLNMNNGQQPGWGYGPNQYGLQPGEYAVLLTAPLATATTPLANRYPPSHLSDNSVSILRSLGMNVAAHAGTTHYSDAERTSLSNCALQIVPVTDPAHPPTGPPAPGRCLAINDPVSGVDYANLSCNQLGSRTMMYFWNDMGAGSDDFDYFNLTYFMNCDKSSTNPDSGSGTPAPSSKAAPAKLIQ